MGFTLEFQDLRYSVTIGHGEHKGETKEILHGVSGACRSGRLMALMGPSGAGKTSLLDILADSDRLVGTAEGTVTLNGAPRRSSTFRKLAAHVPQQDVLVPSATVKEALTTAALLKLPYCWTRTAKLERVQELMKQLGLSHVQDSLVGDETYGMKGLSGGEKRRLSVGIELVSDPALLFLDEPTTGLDSEMALGLMKLLKALAVQGKTVVCTIHQPNSDISDEFDDWHLLASGRTLYAGEWCRAVPYFGARGYNCPRYKAPTDFFMALASDKDLVAPLAASFQEHLESGKAGSTSSACADDTCPDAALVQVALDDAPAAQGLPGGCCAAAVAALGAARPARGSGGGSGPGRQRPPAWYQIWVLSARFWVAWARMPITAAAEAMQYLVLGGFTGLLYWRTPNVLPDGPYDRQSCVFLLLALLSFVPSYTACLVWDYERRLLRHEGSTGTYSRGSFFIAKTLSTTPVEIVQVTAYATMVYWMAGFQPVASKFLVFWATSLLFALCSETIGYLCAIVTHDSKVAMKVVTLVMSVLLAFSGYLVRRVPPYFAWIGKASYFSFATDILVTTEFSGLSFADPAGGPPVPALSFMPDASRTGLGVPGNMAVLLGLTVGARALAWLLVELAARARLL